MYCLQDVQLRWPVKLGLIYCLHGVQLRWPVKVGLMYCLQDLQLRVPVKVGLIYCLQDLQLSWPVKAVWRGRSLLTGFNVSTITTLLIPAYWVSTLRHHTCGTPQCSCWPPWYYIIVLSKSECLWNATYGQICLRTVMKGFCCPIVLHLEKKTCKICVIYHFLPVWLV
jgi:hypothetical protein